MGGTWRLRGYVVESLLGRGASGDVWRARVAATGEKVALKRLAVRDPEQLRRAHAEAAKLAVLDHPHLVRLHALVPDDGMAVLVLDLAEGGSLAHLLAARGRLTPGEVITAIAPVAAALAHVHTAGVVHGDVTPANVLFSADGRALLADLGVARLTGDDADAESTPAYIDPTVAAGGVPAASSDVFMLAACAWHALTGAPPWPGVSPEDALARARAGMPGDIAARLRETGVTESMAAVLRRALDPDPARRGTAASFALDLRHSGVPVAVELSAGRSRPEPVVGRDVPPVPNAAPPRGGRHAALPPRRPPRRSAARRAATTPPPSRDLRAVAPVVADAARPDFGRPDFGRPVVDGVPSAPGAPPPTSRIDPAPRPTIPRPRRRRVARLIAVAAGMLVLAASIAAGGVLWTRHGDGTANAEPRAHASARASAPIRPTSSARPSSPAATRASGGRVGADWPARLEALDAIRARAFAERRPDLLREVYSSPRLLASDTALLERIVPVGCGLDGAHTSYDHVRVTVRAGSVVLTARATLPETRLMCAGTERGRAAAAGPVLLRLTITGAGTASRITAEQRVS